jgi:hypothetical protein
MSVVVVVAAVAAVALAAVAAAWAGPALDRWRQRRDDDVRLRAVVSVLRLFNGGGR